MSRITDLLESLAECLCLKVEESGNPVCFCGVIHGDPVAMYGDSCRGRNGMAWVRLLSMSPVTGVGLPNENVGNCGASLGFEVEVGILRAVSVMDSKGNPPAASAVLADARIQIEDAMTMWRAISCCDALPSRDYILRDYQPMGPLGGYGGGSWQLSAAI